MGKKKRGGNKKKKAGGRGAGPGAAGNAGGGGNHPPAGPVKKQYCGRREVPPSSSNLSDADGAVVGEEELNNAAGAPAKEELQNGASGACAGDADPPGDGNDADARVHREDDGAPIERDDEKVVADGNGVAGDAGPAADNATAEKEAECSPDVPLSDVNGPDTGPPEVHVHREDGKDSDELAYATADVEAVASDPAVEEVPVCNGTSGSPEIKESQEVQSNGDAQEETLGEARSADDGDATLQSEDEGAKIDGDVPSPDSDPALCEATKEPSNECSVDVGDAKAPSTGGEQSGDIGSASVGDDGGQLEKSDSMPTPGAVICNEDVVLSESFSGDEEASPTKRNVGPYLTQLSSRVDSISMEDVDLDAAEEQEPPSSPPLVRAFDGTYNGISPASQDGLSFGFLDSTESEAFGFLTDSLREALSEDTESKISDDTLRRYLRWKPDVTRAADRFRAYRTFRSEKTYLFDNLLLSRDPKLALILKHRLIIAPEELVAKDGSSVVIIRGANYYGSSDHCDDEDASRAIFFVLRQMMERSTLDPSKGISIVLDLVGVTRRNVPKRLHKHLAKAKGCFPLRIRAMYVVAMPWWFPSGYARLFSKKMRNRIHYLKDKAALSEFIEKDRLLEEDGGIYSFDLQQWISSTVLHEVEHIHDQAED